MLAWFENEKNCEKAGFNLNFNKIKQLNEEIEEIDEKMNMYALGVTMAQITIARDAKEAV